MYIRDKIERIEDILKSCEKIERYIEGISKKKFLEDELIQDAVSRNVGIINEAIANVKKELKLKFPSIDWRFIEKYAKQINENYHEIDYAVIFGVCKQFIPEFKIQIEEMIQEMEEGMTLIQNNGGAKSGKGKRR